MTNEKSHVIDDTFLVIFSKQERSSTKQRNFKCNPRKFERIRMDYEDIIPLLDKFDDFNLLDWTSKQKEETKS